MSNGRLARQRCFIVSRKKKFFTACLPKICFVFMIRDPNKFAVTSEWLKKFLNSNDHGICAADVRKIPRYTKNVIIRCNCWVACFLFFLFKKKRREESFFRDRSAIAWISTSIISRTINNYICNYITCDEMRIFFFYFVKRRYNFFFSYKRLSYAAWIT